MLHSARPVRGAWTVLMRGAFGAALLACLGAAGTGPAHAEGALSREAIMKQHQALAQHREDDDPVSSGMDGQGDVASDPVSLAPPLATSSSGSGGRGGTSSSARGSGDLVASLLERVSALEGQVRDMHGQMEQMSNQLHQDEATVDKRLGDMQFALDNGRHASRASAAPAKEAAAAAGAATRPETATDALQAGRAALKARHYAEAEANARTALKQGKSSWSRTEAQFLLAQALAGQKSYKDAALTYYDVYSRSPESPRAPESLLGVSASMLALGNRTASCEALQRLHKEFPRASSRVKASEKIFRERTGCH